MYGGTYSQHYDRRTFGPLNRHVVLSFGFGAFAGFLAGWANTIYSLNALLLSGGSATLFVLLLVSVVAPLVEESIKPIGLYLLNQEQRPFLPIREWTILGAFAGLGFGVLENMFYGLSAASYGGDVGLFLIGMRFLFPLHIICSAIVATGFGLWTHTRDIRLFLKYLMLGVLLHGLFNFTVTLIGA